MISVYRSSGRKKRLSFEPRAGRVSPRSQTCVARQPSTLCAALVSCHSQASKTAFCSHCARPILSELNFHVQPRAHARLTHYWFYRVLGCKLKIKLFVPSARAPHLPPRAKACLTLSDPHSKRIEFEANHSKRIESPRFKIAGGCARRLSKGQSVRVI